MLKRFETLWKRAERQLVRFLPARGGAEINLKDLNTILSLLKRMQDARRALHRELRSQEAVQHHGPENEDDTNETLDAARAARILEQLEGEDE